MAVYDENVRLKAENARLKQWQTYAVVLQARVKRYQLLLHAVPDPSLSSVLAHVIGRARRPFLETMILDAGKAEGVKPGQAVIDTRGMIGRIFLAGEHTSWVILLSDLNSRIPVIDRARPRAGDPDRRQRQGARARDARARCAGPRRRSGRELRRRRHPAARSSHRHGDRRRQQLPRRASRRSRLDARTSRSSISRTRWRCRRAPTAKDLPVTAAGLPPAAPPPRACRQRSAARRRPAIGPARAAEAAARRLAGEAEARAAAEPPPTDDDHGRSVRRGDGTRQRAHG